MLIHFWSGDSRFCGSTEAARQFTFEDNEVTCDGCKENDVFFLSESGYQLLSELGYVDSAGNVI